MHADSLGYAKMRPPGVESNHYAYHLEQLIRGSLVAKIGRSYSLTKKGLALVDRTSHADMTVRLQPQIVTSIHITNETGLSLLYRHSFQPYMGLYGAPQGRLHYSEHVGEAATRELAEKTGLTGASLRHRGIVYVHTTKQDIEISKLLVHVFSGTLAGLPKLAEPTQKGACAWIDAETLTEDMCMPGYKEILELLGVGGDELFFAEIETDMSGQAPVDSMAKHEL